MKIEKAIRILHPNTTLAAIAEIEYYAGFNNEKVIKEIDEAVLCLINTLKHEQEANETLRTQFKAAQQTIEQLRNRS